MGLDESGRGLSDEQFEMSKNSSHRNKDGKAGPGKSNSATSEAAEQAESLKIELERVQAGLVLLSLSVDRLNDVVAVDTKCCGGLFNGLLSPAPVRKGYSSVSMDGSNHDGSIGSLSVPSRDTKLSTSLSINSPASDRV